MVDNTEALSFPVRTGHRLRGWSSALPTALIFMLLAPSFIWIILDKRVWPWDQAWYAEVATDLYFTSQHSISDWYHEFITATPSKPPLLVWLGEFLVPLGNAAGNVEISLLLLVLFAQALTLWFVFLCAKAIAPDSLPSRLLSMLLVGAAPLFIGLGHQFLVEALQTTIVSASLYLSLVQRRLPLIRLAPALIVLVALGFAVKTTSVAYCGITWLYIGSVFVHRVLTERSSWQVKATDGLSIVLSVILTFLVVEWYIVNFGDMLSHIKDATTGASAELYGRRGTLLSKLPFWLRAGNDSFFMVPGVLVTILVASTGLVIFSAIGREGRFRHNPMLPIVAISIFQVILPILMLASQPPEESRYLVAILPNLGLLAAWLFRFPRVRVLAGVLAAATLVQAVVANGESLGMTGHLSNSPWLLPLDMDANRRRIAEDVVEKTCLPENAYRYDVVGPEYQYMNANSLAFLTAKRRLRTGFRCYYTGLGYAETDVGRALARVKDLRANYIIFPQPTSLPTNPDAFNQTLVAAEHAVATSPEFSNVGQVGPYNVFRASGRP